MDWFNKKKLQEQEKQIKKLTLMINDKNSEINKQYNTITHLENNQSRILSENQKLIEWIEKIINEVGIKTKNSYEGQTITIPYYEETKFCYIEGDWNKASMRQKEIVIPEIKYVKTEKVEEVI